MWEAKVIAAAADADAAAETNWKHKVNPECGDLINGHRELTVSSRWSRLRGPIITARRGHSSVTARSQLNHGIFSMITAQSRLGHSSITAQLVTAQSWLAVTILVTVSSRWAHGEQSRWPFFFSWVAKFIELRYEAPCHDFQPFLI